MIRVFSHIKFAEWCKKRQIMDATVNKETDKAFISIVGTPVVHNKYDVYQNEDWTHYFKYDWDNVINLEFDDVDTDLLLSNGEYARTISKEQASKLFDFIENNLGKEFIIHCRAGQSRSQAVAEFIFRYYSDIYKRDDFETSSSRITPNIQVISVLSECYRKKHNLEYK